MLIFIAGHEQQILEHGS